MGALALLPGAAGSAAPRTATTRLTIDRLTYVDGTYRARTHGGFAWLGFDAARSSEAVGSDVPGTRTSQTAVPGAVPEHFESLTLDLGRPGDLTVVMIGRHTGTANPRAVPGSASGNGDTKGRRVTWRIEDAEPGTYTFSALFKPRAFEPNLGTFLPESRVTLTTGPVAARLVLEQHVAPVYGPPAMYAGRPHASNHPVAHPDEWAADPSYVAEGNYSWATGRVGAVRESSLGALTGVDDFTTGSMGSGMSYPLTGPKVNTFMDFTYGRGFRVTGFLHGVVTADALGEFIPLDTYPTGGTIYDGDSATFGIGMSAASVHSREKRKPRDDHGRLGWDWDGAWAEAWSTKDEQMAPATDRTAIQPVLQQESVLYVRASGGDVDNRDGTTAVKGRRWILDLPDHEFGFIFSGASYPPETKYRTRAGFTEDGRFFMRPTIRPGGYMLEGTTDEYFRDWQAAELLSVGLFGTQPEEDPGARRLFTFAPGTKGAIVAATTLGRIERFVVAPGTWELTGTRAGFELRALRIFGASAPLD